MTGTAPNTGLPTSLRFVQIAFGDFGNPETDGREIRSLRSLISFPPIGARGFAPWWSLFARELRPSSGFAVSIRCTQRVRYATPSQTPRPVVWKPLNYRTRQS